MAGRCRCESIGVTGAAADGSDCVEVTGAGTVANPFIVSTVVSPADGNIVSCLPSGLFASAPADRLRVFAVDGTVVNVPPDPATFTDWKIIAESNVLITTAGGDGTITYPTAFPGGVLSVVPILGDSVGGHTTGIIYVVSATTTLSKFDFVIVSDSGTPIGGAIRINYIAVGW